ncbi:MAG: M20/M25/M40 family metallo-hydrolase, partial [Chloroflexota bacterium]|nr:M20/M25/M40 family metallo-hydrolase [Chloroflexota bacterium]
MADPIVAYLERHLDDYLADLRTLVGIDSGSFDKAGVDAVTGWLADRLDALGFAVERRRQERFGDDLVARRAGPGRSRVLLLGHADTVCPQGTAAARPLTANGDKLLGPGTCDMKAGLLAGLYALRALDHAGWTGNGETTFLVVSDEEIGQRHSVPLLEGEGRRHDAILTLEAARENGDVVTARKAVRWYSVEAAGRSAHAGVEPEKGRSATLAIARFVDAAWALNGLREGATVNPGEIAGGGSPS